MELWGDGDATCRDGSRKSSSKQHKVTCSQSQRRQSRLGSQSRNTTTIIAARSPLEGEIRAPPKPSTSTATTAGMSSTKPLTALARARPTSSLLHQTARTPATRVAAFSTSAPRFATPSGPPPAGFRLPKPVRWDQGKESSLDKAGRYFLLTEMMRGMYVVLEQFFRPPYVPPLPKIKALLRRDGDGDEEEEESNIYTATRSTIPSKKVPSRPASAASTPCAATRRARSAASPASYARPSAQPKPSRSRPRSVRTGPGGRRATTST